VVLCIKLIKAVPTELVLALAARHEFTSFSPNDHHFTIWTLLSAKGLVETSEDGHFRELEVS